MAGGRQGQAKQNNEPFVYSETSKSFGRASAETRPRKTAGAADDTTFAGQDPRGGDEENNYNILKRGQHKHRKNTLGTAPAVAYAGVTWVLFGRPFVVQLFRPASPVRSACTYVYTHVRGALYYYRVQWSGERGAGVFGPFHCVFGHRPRIIHVPSQPCACHLQF